MIENEVPNDILKWYKNYFKEDINYPKIMEELVNTSSERSNLLKHYFEPDEKEREEGKKIPTIAHKSIAKLVKYGYIKMILTLNFDRLLEQALSEEGINPIVINTPDALKGAMPFIHNKCTVFKLNGDYLDTRIRNTPEELQSYPDEYNEYLDRVFDEFGLIICGWSSDYDIALRDALFGRKNRRFSTYWTIKNKLSKDALLLLNFLKAQKVNIKGANQFFSEILEHIESLKEFERPHPLSKKIAVESIKRYIAQKNYIKLHDLVQKETERTYKIINSNKFDVNIKCTEDIFRDRMHKYESTLDILIPIMNVISYFGKGTYKEIIQATMERLLPTLKYHATGGLRLLKFYPALLLAYSIGIISLYVENFEVLASILLKTYYFENNKKRLALEAVSALCIFNEPDYIEWITIRESGDNYTRASNYLFKIIKEFLIDTILDEKKYEEYFDIFEYLFGLIYLDKINESKKIEKVKFPYGRFVLKYFLQDSDIKERDLFENFIKDHLIKLLDCGFFNKSLARFKKCKHIYENRLQEIGNYII